MKTGTDREYTAEFRASAVKQVIEGGRGMAAVARSLEMSNKTLANWVYLGPQRAGAGQAPGGAAGLGGGRGIEPAEAGERPTEGGEGNPTKMRQRRQPRVLSLDKK